MDQSAPEADKLHPKGGGDAAQPGQEEPLATVRLNDHHNTEAFQCANSGRVAGFFKNEALVLVPGNYCRVFILPNPNDATDIWGYYTLSAALLVKDNLSGSDEKKAVKNYYGYPAPMIRIGFMGRDDKAAKGLGAALIVDAARRVYRNNDIAAWGLVLESEGGPENKKLWSWYQAQGFKTCRKTENSMYAPLTAFMPELAK